MPLLTSRLLREQTEGEISHVGIDTDESQWRRMSSGRRDYAPYTHTRMQEVALTLYRQNPIAFRILNLIADYIVGEGISLISKDPWVTKILSSHWSQPVNAWGERLYSRVRDFFLFGEMCFLTSVNNLNGLVTLSYVSPLDISNVITDPVNPEIVTGLTLLGNETTENINKTLSVVRVDQDPMSKTFGYRVGQAFYFKMNNVSDAKRGISDIFAVSEWIDGFDQFLWARMERAIHMTNWFWDITLDGADQETVDKYTSNVQANPPRRGSVRVHNEKIDWKANNVKLEGQDASEEAALFRNLIMGGAGMPDFFFAESGAGGRMALAEQAEPTLKSLASRQMHVKTALREIMDFQLDQAHLIQRKRRNKPVYPYDIIMSKISMRNLQRSGGALSRAVDALAKGEERQWITSQEGGRIFRALVDQLGLGVDISADVPGTSPETLSP